jgi:drug/metabolite transporter (DMT)-like permease
MAPRRSSGTLLAVGLLVSLVVAVALHELLVADFALAAVTGLCWGGGVALTLRHLDSPLGTSTGGWSVARWSGAFAGALTLAATVGVSPSLPVSNDLRFALGSLVVGFGVLVFNLGGAMVLDATPEAGDDGA